MTTALATKQIDFTTQQIDTIRQTVARGANDVQLSLFLEFCKARNLDPFTRQVHWTPKGIITGIDGFRAIAERTGAYMPGPTRYEYDADGRLIAAHTTIRKMVSGTWFDLEESAYWEEYAASTPTWAKLKRVMLSKCSEARALRRAFPLDLSGLYESSELDQAFDSGVAPPAPVEHARTVTVQPVEQRPVERSAAFLSAVNAITDASTVEDLAAVAGRITAAKDTLTADEQGELRALYGARRKVLGGAK